MKCEKCNGEHFRTVRKKHEPVGYKCVKCGEIMPLKKSAVKKGWKSIDEEVNE